MDKFIYKLCLYALLGLVVIFIIWQFAWYACIGLIIVGLIYFGFKRFWNSIFGKKNK